jgi:GNAT superfamily N-acetyltransferase
VAAPLSFIPVRTPAQIEEVAALAREIWYEYYVPLIGLAQVDYMVERFQSATAVCAQLDEGYQYFLLQPEAEPAVGYLAVQRRVAENALFLSKIYLRAPSRGTGAGRAALEFVERLGREQGCGRIYLTVNKGNPARFVYERVGYRCAEDIVIDIGGGFVMDDFRMEKILT